mmetsp:Transcript_37305/g.60657  ORF Transcript_37305/g.60657 Transcript_37305/m.60657 type:complete len:263 (+) Transcript_37305:181-969(+)|eukprot:CAMPEP_0203773656 /NCGR_PEP_ID=MMETSP0099_2-20121227/4787_1 /ASSEMBLY_ACC=CAM_ASM_000209 /TAXON_ID=96639 /ORGANISM=" , Strain NY0313808BC1" /LENGTH=262 /DNA_ID=CAMNT_0050671527 /DNA_START=164 /DNA_END=952 /DNA_ORIENTATION=-
MSSLSAARADNFYQPPDYDPDKPRKHAPRNQWEKYGVIRFEMMFTCWCTLCGRIVEKGTRFNAKKETQGSYLSTPIYEFSMKCASCDNNFVVRTDPENASYKLVSGLRRTASQIVQDQARAEQETAKREQVEREKDPFSRFEHKVQAIQKSAKDETYLTKLQKKNELLHRDNYSINQMLRAKNRTERKLQQEHALEGRSFGLPFPLLAKSTEDNVVEFKEIKTKKRSRFDKLSKAEFKAGPVDIDVAIKIKKKKKRKSLTIS